jgi:hypothetical protein
MEFYIMAHYAFIGYGNKVVKVIVGVDETVTQTDLDGTIVGGSSEAWEQFYQNQPQHQGLLCKRTSYNNKIRKQYAGIGFTYDASADVFVAPQPFPSWTLDSNHDWQPPTPKPEGQHYWKESTLQWVAFN